MANAIDPELYPGNNAFSSARPVRHQLNPTTGAEEAVPLSGLTDLRIYVAATAITVDHEEAIDADLVETMAEVEDTAAYQATIDGDALTEHVETEDGGALYVHWQSLAARYHEVARVIWRTSRPAAAA